MQAQLDVGKLVGAASAPVALIIASSIFLGNLGGKYAMLMAHFREASGEYRKAEERTTVRCRSLERQMALQAGRLRSLRRATLLLTLSMQSFILTVLSTSVGVIFPTARLWTWVTGSFGLIGLLLLSASVVIEMRENDGAHEDLLLETAEFCHVLETGTKPDEMTRVFAGQLDSSGG